MLPTAIIVGLIIGRWWAIPLAAALLVALDAIDGGGCSDCVPGAGVAALNALVGVAVHVAVREVWTRVSGASRPSA